MLLFFGKAMRKIWRLSKMITTFEVESPFVLWATLVMLTLL